MLQRNKCSMALSAALLAAGVLAVSPAEATITVSLSPANQVVLLADGTATVDIVAVIPEADAIVAWGLDLELFGTSVSIDSSTVNEPTWTATTGADPDGLAGLAPSPPGTAIWSDPATILLATVTFAIDEEGVTNLTLSDDNPDDLTEGFALDPPPVGEFADVNYVGGSITVIPEPASFVLALLGGVAVLRRRG